VELVYRLPPTLLWAAEAHVLEGSLHVCMHAKHDPFIMTCHTRVTSKVAMEPVKIGHHRGMFGEHE
jgi:hypothetical protein